MSDVSLKIINLSLIISDFVLKLINIVVSFLGGSIVFL